MARGHTAQPREPAPSFEESMRQAEADAGVPTDADLYSEFIGPDGTPEPDETGRMPASRPPTNEAVDEVAPGGESASESAAETGGEALVEEPTTPLFAGKFQTAEEMEAAFLEQQTKLGTMANENAEMRRITDDVAQLREQIQAQPAPQLNEATVNWFDDLAANNPQQAAEWARTNQHGVLLDRAVRAWYDDDPIAAGRYERWLEMQTFQANLTATLQPQIAGAQQLAQNAEMERALGQVQGRHTDFAEVVGALDETRLGEIVTNGFPVEVLQGLQGDTQAKERVFETLYRWVKADRADGLVAAAQAAPKGQTDEQKAAKIAATVASSTVGTPEATTETEQERLTRVWSGQRPSLRAGWQGRDTRP